jgi:glucose/arabinose dehydrogenase
MRTLLPAIAVVLALATPGPASAGRFETSAGPVEVTRVLSGLTVPWSVGLLPDGGLLVTERGGRLLHVADPAAGRATAVAGVPAVWANGQGGLFDVVPARDFATTRELFLSYAEPRGDGAGTALAVARLAPGGARLEDVRVIFRMAETSDSGQHFGGRVVEAPDGALFLTIGDRGARDAAQDLGSHRGKVIRVARDGSIPADNPFVGRAGARPEIWSLGHRNDQGAALGRDGALWTVMHGPRGGDAVHRPRAGRNYGWPVVSYGSEYATRRPVGATSAPGVEQPLHYWVPSIAPSGLAIHSGRSWAEWEGDLFVGALQADAIVRLDGDATGVREVERLLEGVYPRIRDVREGPDGALWFLSESDGALYRMAPATGG